MNATIQSNGWLVTECGRRILLSSIQQYELREHKIILTTASGRDTVLDFDCDCEFMARAQATKRGAALAQAEEDHKEHMEECKAKAEAFLVLLDGHFAPDS